MIDLFKLKIILFCLFSFLFECNSSPDEAKEFEKYSKNRIVYYSSLDDIHSIYKKERDTVFLSGIVMGTTLSLAFFSMLINWDLLEFKFPKW